MNKFWLLLVIVLSSNCYATLTLIPTIDGDESIWLDREGDTIYVESPFILGMTSPDIETFYFFVSFKYDRYNILFDISQLTTDAINFRYDGVPDGMLFDGTLEGPSMLFDDVLITGMGDIDIYLDSAYIPDATYLGTISVVPEPMSIFLFSAGFFLMRKGFKK